MRVYELIQKLCENDPNHEVIIRVDGKCDRLMEYIEDSQNCAMEWSEIWATVDAVHVQKGIDKVFVDCDLSRL
jgi:hypothetical protein